MYLTKEEEKILNGEQGPIKQKCMEFLVEYGDVSGAEKLVDIDGTVDVHPLGFFSFSGITLKQVKKLANNGKKFKVPTYSNKPTPGFFVHGEEDLSYLEDDHKAGGQISEMEPLIKMGMTLSLSCDYYLTATDNPRVGQHCAWGESSAIPWCNAILGARCNYDGCFEAAYLGKIPKYDMHLDENRTATRLVKFKGELENDMDYGLFGWTVGEAVGIEVPVITGVGKPTTSQLIKMNAELNTGGQVRMYHIPKLTPEACSMEEALNYDKPEEKISIGREDLKEIYEKVNYASDEDVDFVYLGCPHYTLREVWKTANLLRGRKCESELWIMTSPETFRKAEKMGLRKIIRKAGGKLLSGTCPGMMDGFLPPNTEVMATDSAKQNYYITGFVHPKDLEVWYGSTAECIEAAISGKWNGKWGS